MLPLRVVSIPKVKVIGCSHLVDTGDTNQTQGTYAKNFIKIANCACANTQDSNILSIKDDQSVNLDNFIGTIASMNNIQVSIIFRSNDILINKSTDALQGIELLTLGFNNNSSTRYSWYKLATIHTYHQEKGTV